MPNDLIRNFTTLNHLYNPPVHHRRNFLQENKEHVRGICNQRTKDKTSIAGFTPQTSSAEQINSRLNIIKTGTLNGMSSQTRHPLSKATTKTSNVRSLQSPKNNAKKQPWTYGREAADRKSNVAKIETLQLHPKRPLSSNKTKVKITSSKAIQTDDIDDEIFLYNALKKCASPAFKSALKAKYVQKDKPKHNENDNCHDLELPLDDSHEVGACEPQESAHISPERQKAGGYVSTGRSIAHTTDNAATQLDTERSAGTNTTTRESNFNRRMRDQLDTLNNVMTLPADGLAHCSPSKCANCPAGYHLLTEEERVRIRNKLLDHESLLIKQLNSFPLAIETLRVRQSKTRIEKELTIIEQNLRKLTKRKVYAKVNE